MLVAVYPAPLGLDVPAPRPLPQRHPPPRGRAIQTRKGGKAVLGLGGRGDALPPKKPPPGGGGASRCGPAPSHAGRAGLATLPPTNSRGCARASRLPPSTAAMATAPGPRLRAGLFAPAAAVASAAASAWCGGAGCAALRCPPA